MWLVFLGFDDDLDSYAFDVAQLPEDIGLGKALL